MNSPEDPKKQSERAATDANLHAERTKTDFELAQTRHNIDSEANHVLEVARVRAEATLRAARELADARRGNPEREASSPNRDALALNRAAEDQVLATEQAAAADQLDVEREEHERALSSLLHRERAATDDGLVLERARADEVVSTRDDFLAMVSHDLRTMLSTIGLNAAVLARHATMPGGGGDVALRHAERITRFTARMDRVVGDLLDVVSLESGMLHVTPQSHDVLALVKDAVEAFQPAYAARGVELRTDLAEGAMIATFDHERILQVLANLFSNALKFTEHGGTVTLAVERSSTDMCFSVTDTGIGIPADQVTAIFDRFRQVTINDRRGLGLGLYIAKSIVEAHGGSIWAERPVAGGTSLKFMLPAAGPSSTRRTREDTA